MPISPQLQAKIDALEDEDLRNRILRLLKNPAKKRAANEEIFESLLLEHTVVKERQAQLRQWSDEEVEAFMQYFCKNDPSDYVEFLKQEKEFNEIELGLAANVRHLMSQWIPGVSVEDRRGLFIKFRDYAKRV
ncbi:hypothetical protein [Lysobacter sp. CA199]|uniref:hypothetical protein n=1 Tax=Lysobacter sp. CA199 TaxID=3455608 RepID=UPI003F8CFAE0